MWTSRLVVTLLAVSVRKLITIIILFTLLLNLLIEELISLRPLSLWLHQTGIS